jgi:hypothetical protein
VSSLDTGDVKLSMIDDEWDYWQRAGEEDDGKSERLTPLRDKLSAHLEQVAGSAQPASGSELVCCGGSGIADIGYCKISQGPIRWVAAMIDFVAEDSGLVSGETEYGIPDQRPLPSIGIYVRGVKNLPVVGQVVDVRWKAVEGQTKESRHVADSLTGNRRITEAMLATGSLDDDVVVRACPQCNTWWIWTLWPDPALPHPSPQKWACYEMIAKHLLAVGVR